LKRRDRLGRQSHKSSFNLSPDRRLDRLLDLPRITLEDVNQPPDQLTNKREEN